MPSFSQRIGIKPLEKPLQIESVDQDLLNSLWTELDLGVLSKWTDYRNQFVSHAPSEVRSLLMSIWTQLLKKPLDRAGQDGGAKLIRDHYFACRWNEVYDFIEFTVQHVGNPAALEDRYNAILQRENAGYRFIKGTIVPISNPAELAAIEDAYKSGLAGVDVHIRQAVVLLSNRSKPDYRNAIKEAVSAVESACRIVSKNEKATLGQAIKAIGEKGTVHPALEKAFSSLYGYTSDEGGIRHSLLEESSITFTDAKFMVVACSAFVNYLVGKVADNQRH
jgi:hypothetical protein